MHHHFQANMDSTVVHPSIRRGYLVQSGNRLFFHRRWYVRPGRLSRLRSYKFKVYYVRRDDRVLYIFLEGSYVGEAYCPQFMGNRISEWEARAIR